MGTRILKSDVSMSVDMSTFPEERLRQVADMERWHFWFAGRRRLVDGLLGAYFSQNQQSVLDVGCGTGLMAEILVARGYRVSAIDLRAEGLRDVVRGRSDLRVAQANAMQLPFCDSCFDAVMLFDTLEHSDDLALLREAYRILKPKGQLLLTVPALPWLWSYRDVAAGHQRRYTRKKLSRVLVDSGFLIAEVRYFQVLLLPILIILRVLGRGRRQLRDLEDSPPRLANVLMKRIFLLEAKLSSRLPAPIGSSLAAVGQKP